MVKNPEKYITTLKQKGFKKVIFHYSSTKNLEKTINIIKKNNLIPYIAINPIISIKKVLPYLKQVKGVLFMGVIPGKEHQSFLPGVYKKISQLRKLNKKIKIQVDGGANEKVIKRLAKLGVNYINSGSYISSSDNPKEQYKKLNSIFKKATTH